MNPIDMFGIALFKKTQNEFKSIEHGPQSSISEAAETLQATEEPPKMDKTLGMAILGMGNQDKPTAASNAAQEDIANNDTSYPMETKEGSKTGTPKKAGGNMLNQALAEIASLK